MPTYDYLCNSCGHSYELFQRMSEDPQKKCPKCGKKVTRLIGAGSGVVFKGSGFYETDYRSDSYSKQAAAEKKAASGEGKKDSSAKGESKSSESKSTESKSSDSKPSKKKD